MRKTVPVLLLAFATTFGAVSVAEAAPPGMKTEMNGRVADQLRDQGPSGLLGRKCEGMHNIPVWGTLRANKKKQIISLESSRRQDLQKIF